MIGLEIVSKSDKMGPQKNGKKGSSPIWWSGLYANWLSESDTVLRTTSVEDMIRQIKNEIKYPDRDGVCGHCIHRLVIRAHGNKGIIWLGEAKTGATDNIGSNINPDDPAAYVPTLAEGLASLKPYFCRDAVIVLWSCNTGQDMDFLHRLANLTGAKVEGLTVTTGEYLNPLNGKGQWNSATPAADGPSTRPAR